MIWKFELFAEENRFSSMKVFGLGAAAKAIHGSNYTPTFVTYQIHVAVNLGALEKSVHHFGSLSLQNIVCEPLIDWHRRCSDWPPKTIQGLNFVYNCSLIAYKNYLKNKVTGTGYENYRKIRVTDIALISAFPSQR